MPIREWGGGVSYREALITEVTMSVILLLSLNCVTEVEKFVEANTQELGKDKWLCPLSGKKFKGPAFVRKHIFNKHIEKIEEVKKEVSTLFHILWVK